MSAPVIDLLSHLAETGRVGRVLTPTLDLVRSAGWRAARSQQVATIEATKWGPRARRHIYRHIWRDAAEEVGADFTEYGEDFFVLSKGSRETTVWFHHVMLDTAVRLQVALNKGLVHRMMSREGHPVPPFVRLHASDAAIGSAFVEDSAEPCVVKPVKGTSGGDGVTCGVSTSQQFKRARLWAWRWDDELLVEQQARGDEYRLLFLDGELLDVVRRRSPYVTGDGDSSVAELIASENRRRAESNGWEGLSLLGVDLDCLLRLEEGGLSLRSVPPTGAVVKVKSAVSENGAADNFSVDRCEVSPDLIKEAAAATQEVGIRLAGVDVITPDCSKGLREAGGVIVEVNGTPGLHYHYVVADRASACRVAVPVLRTLLGESGEVP